MIITIDGPSASGKSSLARALSKRLGFFYIYSGLLYRAWAYLLQTNLGYTTDQFSNPNPEDIIAFIDPKRFKYLYDELRGERVFFDGKDITPYLKESAIDQTASLLSTNPFVREWLTGLQRNLAATHKSVVVDGRDAGTVVFPQAEYKFFLTANQQERAKRWQQQQQKQGVSLSLDEALSFLQKRDERDSRRAVAPLAISHNARIVDNSTMSRDQTLQMVLGLIQKVS